MEYKEIVSVTGEAGLFQLLSSKSDGAIVRSLDGKITKFIPSRNHNFTPLESIEVFTTGENVLLADVFRTMRDKETVRSVPDANADNKTIKSYFQEVFPSLDEERVYQSDMKKMLKWFPQLKNADLLKFEEKAEAAKEEMEKKADDGTKEKDKVPERDKEEHIKTKAAVKKADTEKKIPTTKEKTSRTKTGVRKAPK